MSNPYGILELANKAFGFTPHYTLWDMSYQMLNSMIMEAYYRNKEPVQDEKGEYEWIEVETYDGETKKVKKYKDPSIL